jgi:hypothetical protein
MTAAIDHHPAQEMDAMDRPFLNTRYETTSDGRQAVFVFATGKPERFVGWTRRDAGQLKSLGTPGERTRYSAFRADGQQLPSVFGSSIEARAALLLVAGYQMP